MALSDILLSTYTDPPTRVFKTAWFRRAANKIEISDVTLCRRIRQAQRISIGNLGGGVVKIRLKNNLYRSIVLTDYGHLWIYVHLYAKQDSANIKASELSDFRKLAILYQRSSATNINIAVSNGDLFEICHDEEANIQKQGVGSDS
ncbi:type II toxin-antitoxin system RelE/ParE family toxin [Paralcaligenes ureilyticus]|uniref:Uncharacterized protein n=1 Tax=Paralcaligenes ureilyticus TaxID=627131 RepID=A0A4R3M466_9BURK|nr:hypothetical protein EDC26_106107 [Paralcaligenes ureilyticus]